MVQLIQSIQKYSEYVTVIINLYNVDIFTLKYAEKLPYCTTVMSSFLLI
jgi:hypothetical protein